MKAAQIVPLLSKLGVRRQAKLDQADYDVLAEDLVKFDLRDIEGGLDDIPKYPRREGETAFPELARLKQAIVERKLLREEKEICADEAREAAERAAHPEEYMSAADFWQSEEVRAIMAKGKSREMPTPAPATTYTMEQLQVAIDGARARRESMRPAPEVQKAEEVQNG